MKQTTLASALILFLACPASLLAEEPATAQAAPQAATPGDAASPVGNPGTPCPRHGMGMMHQGKGPQGAGRDGMQHGGDHEKERAAGHLQVMQRLELIEARLAKIEAMLEALIRR